MMFVLRMWWREVRTSWARLSFFFLSVAIGVAAIVALRSVTQTVRFTPMPPLTLRSFPMNDPTLIKVSDTALGFSSGTAS